VRCFPFAALLLFALLSFDARAGEIVLPSGEKLVYADPPGLCVLDPAGTPGERSIFQLFEAADGGQLVTLALLYDCPFVDWLRSGSAEATVDPATWVRIAAAKGNDGLLRYSGSRASLLEEGAAELERLMGSAAAGDLQAELDAAVDRVNDSLQQADPASDSFQLSHIEPLGLLAQEPEAVYAGVLASMALGAEQEVVLSLLAVTLLKQHIVSVYFFRPYENAAQVESQLGELRVLVQDLVARNDPEGGGSFLGLDWDKTAGVGLIGALVAVAAVVLVVFLRRRRRKI
jgi:hypothetical protein